MQLTVTFILKIKFENLTYKKKNLETLTYLEDLNTKAKYWK